MIYKTILNLLYCKMQNCFVPPRYFNGNWRITTSDGKDKISPNGEDFCFNIPCIQNVFCAESRTHFFQSMPIPNPIPNPGYESYLEKTYLLFPCQSCECSSTLYEKDQASIDQDMNDTIFRQNENIKKLQTKALFNTKIAPLMIKND